MPEGLPMNWNTAALAGGGVLLVLAAILTVIRTTRLKNWGWLVFYGVDRVRRIRQSNHRGRRHVLFLFVDHFEPHAEPALAAWLDGYARLAARHHDADGRPPRHTWFYPLERFDEQWVGRIMTLCRDGLGEIEVHLHHQGDTEASLREKMRGYLARAARLGLFTQSGKQGHAFSFIHGNWALDNSRHGDYCGVNSELKLLKELGCYADFTFPAHSEMQPFKVNRIYYATDNVRRPKSYTWGRDVRVGGRPSGDLMIFQGPLAINWRDWSRRAHPRCEGAGIEFSDEQFSPRRAELWVNQGIGVAGRPDWIFVKIHTHGLAAGNFDLTAGEQAHQLFTDLENRYNDGARYVLHYVTAREAYNMVKAAEAGKTGDPMQYRDFLIKPGKYLES
jgi:hypothetical protein